MAKRQVVTTTKQFLDEPEPKQEAAEMPSEQELSWAAFKGKFSINQGAKVKVYRQTPKGRQYCFYDVPSAIDEETVRLFHCKQPYASEAGEYFLALEIDGQLQEPFPVYISPQIATPGADIQTEGHGGMAQVVRLLQAQNERLEQRLMQQERTPMSEMVDCMYKLDQMRGANASAGNSLDNILKCIEIGQKMGPNAGNQEWWQVLLEAIKENGPLLQTVLMRMSSGAMAAPVPATAAIQPQQAAQVDTPAAAVEGEKMEQMERMLLAQTVAYLKKKALAGSDPGLYIDLVLDNKEDPIYARLLSEVADKDFSTFAAIDPDIEKQQYRSFFVTIYDGLRSYLIQTNSVGPAAGGKAGNKADAASNGASGKGGRK